MNNPKESRPLFLKNKNENLRWIVLLLSSLVLVGDAYCFDNPEAIQSDIIRSLKISKTEFNLLYSVVSIPNMIMPFFGGFFIDFFGVKVSLFLFSGLLIIGQLVFTYGGYLEHYLILVLGRFIFGLGNESLQLCPTAIISSWFKNKEMALAMGLAFSFPKLGSAANSFLTPRLYKIHNNLGLPFFFGSILCLVSFTAGFALFYFDSKNEIDTSPDIEKTSAEADTVEKISFSDMKNLKRSFWMLLLICAGSEGVFISFLDNANSYYQTMFKYDEVTAGSILTIPYFLAAVIAPLFGIIVDSVGRRGKFIILACLTFLFTFSIYFFLDLTNESRYLAIMPLVFLGICYSLYATVVMGSIPLVVEERILGTALGTISVFQNFLMAIFPLITGFICDQFNEQQQNKGFTYTSLFFMLISLFITIVACYLNWLDRSTGGILERVQKKEG